MCTFIRDNSAFQLGICGKGGNFHGAHRAGQSRASRGASQWPGGASGTDIQHGYILCGSGFCRHSSKSMAPQPIAPLPTPAPIAQRAGDVEIGGVHLLEFHWNTVLGGGGLVLLIVVVIALTYCCVRGYLQVCCLNSCRLCCPSDHGVGGDLVAQGRH